MSTPLKTYRIYCFDADRKMLSGDWLNAADDADAVARAHAQGFGTQCEIWDGPRLVAQLEAQRLQA